MQNNYFALRHGHSQANEQGIVLADPKNGVSDYGLTERGKSQVKTSVKKALEDKILDENTIIYSSDFLRTKETAQITQEILGAKEIIFTPALRERYFGDLEKQSNENYEKVWQEDNAKKPSSYKAEDVQDVLNRVLSLIDEIEKNHSSQNTLLVSHGDTLQILQTYFTQTEPYWHRQMPHLDTAEIRKLT